MPDNEYSPEEALGVLMRKIRERDELLAEQVQAAIDAGKDISEVERSMDRRKKERVYRKTVPFTHEEALEIAVDVLQAHFVEQPLFVESAAINFTKAGLAHPSERLHRSGFGLPRLNSSKEREKVAVDQVGEKKAIEIELQTETQIKKSGPATQTMQELAPAEIEERRQQLSTLREMVDFQR